MNGLKVAGFLLAGVAIGIFGGQALLCLYSLVKDRKRRD